MTDRITHLEKVRQENASIRLQVLNVLGWDELAYGEFQEEAGLNYLTHTYGPIPLIEDLPKHKAFWSWWVNHWVRRDREFLEMSGLLFPNELENYYKSLHDPASFQFHPHSIILEDSWETMVHALIKEAVR